MLSFSRNLICLRTRQQRNTTKLNIFPSSLNTAVLKMGILVDIVTLDNLMEKMPRWDPNGSNHLYALVDMGR